MSKDILLDENNEIKIFNGDFDTGESEMQEVALILQSTQGEWKMSPLLGPNLFRFLKSKESKVAIEKQIAIHLAIDNKDFKSLKTKIETQIKNYE
jgi:hypothetical protein